MLAVQLQPFFPPKDLLRDANFNVRYGLISNIGIFMWLAASAISLFIASSGSLISKITEKHYFYFAGFFSLFLFNDDFFKIHEYAWPLVTGLSEDYFYAMYLIAVAIYLALYFKRKNKEYTFLMLGAFGFLALGMAGDVFGLGYMFEDGTKFIGISLWLTFHWLDARSVLDCGKA